MRERKPFFQSVRHPHCEMNKWGVVFVPNGHPDGVDYWGRSFDVVPLRNGLLDLLSSIEDEARELGYRQVAARPDWYWLKPHKESRQ